MKLVNGLIIAMIALAYAAIAHAGKIYTKGGNAIDGYDAVAYFTDSKAVKGDSTHSYKWNGATWHFSSAKNLDLFKADPDKYAPQYGGHCAFAMAEAGKLVKANPKKFDVKNSKLYLNYNSGTQKKWEADSAGMIKRGDANYKKL